VHPLKPVVHDRSPLVERRLLCMPRSVTHQPRLYGELRAVR
jgi:hypothetical protein